MAASSGPRDVHSNPPGDRGRWLGDGSAPQSDVRAIRDALADLNRTVILVHGETAPALAEGGRISFTGDPGYPILAMLPPIPASSLGDRAFCAEHRLRFAYVTGAMANGI